MITKEMVIKLAEEIRSMQELADDKDATIEMRSNARSYIRGVKKAMDIITGQDKDDFEVECDDSKQL